MSFIVLSKFSLQTDRSINCYALMVIPQSVFQSTATCYCSAKMIHCESKFYYFMILQWLEVDFCVFFVYLTLYCIVDFEKVILDDHSNTVFMVKVCLLHLSTSFWKREVINIIHTGIHITISQHMTLCMEWSPESDP